MIMITDNNNIININHNHNYYNNFTAQVILNSKVFP